MKVKIFADGADRAGIERLAADPNIAGFTTNPTLMRQAGVDDYECFAREILEIVTDRPISFEVFSDDLDEMERQALRISTWAPNVNVKIPVTNTKGERTDVLLKRLVERGTKVNVTAVFTVEQVEWVASALANGPQSFVSVFAGRIADAGIDPLPIMRDALSILRGYGNQELIWASPREVFNIVQADSIGCDIITVTHDLLKKLPGIGKSLEQFSLETVQMFYNDACAAGYSL
ncbi:MAG TPA: transaldolase [Acidimicrobiales bacterium]